MSTQDIFLLPSSIKANPSRGGDAKLWALNRPEGGTDKAARLPKGWTGPVSMLGFPGFRKEARIFLCASRLRIVNREPRTACSGKSTASPVLSQAAGLAIE